MIAAIAGGAAGELESHVCGISAPVLDVRQRPAAIVSIWGPRDRMPASRFDELGTLVREAADEISTALG